MRFIVKESMAKASLKGILMPDVITIGLLGIAGNLLGSLNKSRPADDFEAVKIIDENDPIRCILHHIINQIPPGTMLVFVDGTHRELYAVLELAYGAARVLVSDPIQDEALIRDIISGQSEIEPVNRIMVIRYNSVQSVFLGTQPQPRSPSCQYDK